MKSLRMTLLAAAFALGAPVGAFAGPFQDFEAEAGAAYAAYRQALFQTNRNDGAASRAALEGFANRWSALRARWSAAPPPQYDTDKDFAPLLGRVGDLAGKATGEVAAGKLGEAHETLERIRDELASLRGRNGIVSFSDRMNAYHHVMEHVLGEGYDNLSPAGMAMLREDAAVLVYLARDLAEKAPATLASDPAFGAALAALRGSVAALQAAARSGQPEAIKAALKALKPPYAQMFVRFG